MKKFYRNFVIASIVLWSLVALFAVLFALVNPLFKYFAVVSAIIALVLFCVYELFMYKTLNKKIDAGFAVYLQDYYRDGFITKAQLESGSPELLPEYKKLYKKDKSLRLVFFIFGFALAVALTTYLIKVLF